MKCAYRHCKYGGVVDKGNAVKIENRYYHPECLKEKNDIQEIINLYVYRVDPNPIFSQLKNIINEIIYKNGYSAEYLLFSLRYYLSVGKKLKSAYGLHYLVKNADIKKAWETKQNQEQKEKVAQKHVVQDEKVEFSLPEIKQAQTSKRKKISSILGV